MTTPPEVAAVLAEMRDHDNPKWIGHNDWADRIESALTKAEAALRYVRWHPKHGYRWADTHDEPYEEACGWISVPLYTHPTQPAAVPVAWAVTVNGTFMYSCEKKSDAKSEADVVGSGVEVLVRPLIYGDTHPTQPAAVPVDSDLVLKLLVDAKFIESAKVEHARRIVAEFGPTVPPAPVVPDGWLRLGVGAHPERNTRVVYWHTSDNGGFQAIADEWRDEHHLAFASHWHPSASTKPTSQEGAAP